MRITTFLWAAGTGTHIPRRMNRHHVREILGLSERQWPIFLRVSLAVCKEFPRAFWGDLNPAEKQYLTQKIRDSVQEEGLPVLDDKGIEWRVSKVLPELRHYTRFADQYGAWETTAGRTFPNKVIREACDANIHKIPTKGLRYWTQIPEEIRLELATEVNKRLVESGLPAMDEEALLYRIRKHMNHWIREKLGRKPSRTGS
ncbi:uncharacterized protein ALTATR162_LOCUS759 [Alternaria atra]|uniref:Uncharacterized protein n=1 Tax=Alternaria atra TaxID=119953 RepID=A0A8J2HSE6_9PLEO|nr:uncharacterized protein ALTATR162_LOCUS759 [Alternaria atra]CAG5140670.1 unnamed protein product [Alternaria atra]